MPGTSRWLVGSSSSSKSGRRASPTRSPARRSKDSSENNGRGPKLLVRPCTLSNTLMLCSVHGSSRRGPPCPLFMLQHPQAQDKHSRQLGWPDTPVILNVREED